MYWNVTRLQWRMRRAIGEHEIIHLANKTWHITLSITCNAYMQKYHVTWKIVVHISRVNTSINYCHWWLTVFPRAIFSSLRRRLRLSMSRVSSTVNADTSLSCCTSHHTTPHLYMQSKSLYGFIYTKHVEHWCISWQYWPFPQRVPPRQCVSGRDSVPGPSSSEYCCPAVLFDNQPITEQYLLHL